MTDLHATLVEAMARVWREEEGRWYARMAPTNTVVDAMRRGAPGASYSAVESAVSPDRFNKLRDNACATASLAALQSVLSARGAKVVAGELTTDMIMKMEIVYYGHDGSTNESLHAALTAALSAAPDLLSSEGV